MQESDGCTPDCKAETTVCGDGIKSDASLSFDWETSPPTLLPGVLLTEACDDGNVLSGDGCSPECTIEIGWLCYVPLLPEGRRLV